LFLNIILKIIYLWKKCIAAQKCAFACFSGSSTYLLKISDLCRLFTVMHNLVHIFCVKQRVSFSVEFSDEILCKKASNCLLA